MFKNIKTLNILSFSFSFGSNFIQKNNKILDLFLEILSFSQVSSADKLVGVCLIFKSFEILK